MPEKEEGFAVFAPNPVKIGSVGLALMDSLAENSSKIIDVQSGSNVLEMEEYLNNRAAVKTGARRQTSGGSPSLALSRGAVPRFAPHRVLRVPSPPALRWHEAHRPQPLHSPANSLSLRAPRNADILKGTLRPMGIEHLNIAFPHKPK